MAIQVSGTTVIDDSRNLTNIASVDATTVASISAAGVGGGGTHDFVASGAISNGDVVALNADGTVSVVSASAISQAVGSQATFESSYVDYVAATYDSSSNKIIVAYQDYYNSRHATVAVGTVNGTSITFGTPVSVGDSAIYISVSYDSSNNKVVVFYVDDAGANYGYGTAIVGTVSGTSISFGSPVVFESDYVSWVSSTYDSSNNKVVVCYRTNAASNYGVAKVGTVSGTSISFGSRSVFESALTDYINAAYDSQNNKVVIAYQDRGNSNYGTSVVGTISGTAITFGTPVVFNAGSTDHPSICFDSNSSNIVISFRDRSNSDYGTAIVGTVSGTSISYGTKVVFENANSYNNNISANTAGEVVNFYTDGGNSSYGTFVKGTVNGTSISFDSPTVVNNGSTGTLYSREASVYDSTNNVFVFSYRKDASTGYGSSNVIRLAQTNASSYIGIAAEAISDTATGEITITSGINEGQTGLTIGQSYFVADDGTLTTTNNGRKIGEALSATNLQVKTKLTGDEMNEYLGGLV